MVRNYYLLRWSNSIVVIFKEKNAYLLEVHANVHMEAMMSGICWAEEVVRGIDLNGHAFVIVITG